MEKDEIKIQEDKKEETFQSKNIFESLLEDSDKEYNIKEIPSYFKEVRLAVIGNVDSGKSTLVGCLTKGIKDDGRGYARKFVFNYQHETQSGRTSSIAEEIMGFKNGKLVLAGRAIEKKNVAWKEITSKSDHVITLLDLCGHEKYLKTTMYGISALIPHYAAILIGTNMGAQRMTKEHLGIVVSLGLPFFIVYTKIDIAPKEAKEKTINAFSLLLKNGLLKTPFNVKSDTDAEFCAKEIAGGNVVPIFQVSTVTGEGMDYLYKFLGLLKPRYPLLDNYSIIKSCKDKTEMLLDNAFNTKVGCIFAGLITSGKVYVNQKLLLGPIHDGTFKPVQVREIQFLRTSVNELNCGNSCSVKLKSLDKTFELKSSHFKKGMVLLDNDTKLEPVMEFEVEAVIVHHSSTIKVGYQSMVHCHAVRQTCTIIKMDKEYLRAGEKGIVTFKFLKKPEYLHVGDVLLFREGRTRGRGKIIKLFPFDIEEFNKQKKAKTMKARLYRAKMKINEGNKNKETGNQNNKGEVAKKNDG